MAPEVFFTVCYRKPNVPEPINSKYVFTPAILHGYCRRRVQNADYPGITSDPEHNVRGTLATGLTPADIKALDDFEGSEYVKETVKVKVLTETGDEKTGEGNVEGEELDAMVYVFLDPSELEDREWDFEEFRREKLRKWTRSDYVFSGV